MAQAFLVNQLKQQMVKLIESYEPQLEAGLRSNLSSIRVSNPNEAAIFLQKWKQLDRAVVESLRPPAPMPAPVRAPAPSMGFFRRGGKRTKKHTGKK
jgi:hypothetical protein